MKSRGGVMKKSVLAGLALVLAGLAAPQLAAQNGVVAGYCEQGATKAATSGLPSSNYLQGLIPLCKVTVYLTGTTTLVPNNQIYSDKGGTILGNPFTANALGAWQFYATALNAYDVVLSGGNPPNAYTNPVTLVGLVPAGFVNGAPLDPLAYGCVPDSTVPADMSANVTCLNTLGNLFNRAYLPAGHWNINQCLNFTNFGGFIWEGAGVNGTYIIQNTDNTCGMQFSTSFFPNEFRISDMTIGHARAQTPPHDLTVNSAAPAIFLSGPHGASIFNYEFSRLAFTKSSRGIEMDHTISGTSWGYDINGIRGNSDLQGALINLCGTGAGNPRIHIQRIEFTAPLTTEPAICISQGQEVGVDDVEYTPAGSFYSTPASSSFSITSNVATVIGANNLAAGQKVAFTGFSTGTYFNDTDATVLATGLSAGQYEFAFTHADVGSTADAGIATVEPFPTALALGGSIAGKASNIHIESYLLGTSGAPLITAENSQMTFESVSAAVDLCPAPYPCHTFGSANMYLLSNIAGGGNISLKNFVFSAPFSDGNPNGTLYGMRYNANGSSAECTGMFVGFLPAGYSAACIDPNSDLGRSTRNNNQYVTAASATTANSWVISSVATSSGGAAVYTGTFTGCVTGAVQYGWITGFIATPANNGFFKIRSCTPTTLTAVNGSAVAETQAATIVNGVGGVGMPNYGRIFNGASSQTVNCTPNVQPMYNAVTTLWDTYMLNFCSGIQTSSQVYLRPPGWIELWTGLGDTSSLTTEAPSLSGIWVIGGLAPTDTSGARPTLRGYSNEGTVFAAADFRSEIDGSGGALWTLCNSTNNAFAKGNEVMQTLGHCTLMGDHNGNLFGSQGLSTIVIPAGTVSGYKGVSTGGVQLTQTGATGSIGGGALGAGACASGTATITTAATGHTAVAAANDGTFIGGSYTITATVSGTTATVNVCAVIAGTPAAKTYNVTVF